MKQEGYNAAKRFFDTHKGFTKLAVAVQKGSEILVYIIYPTVINILFFQNNPFWYKSLAVCATGFVAVSIFRNLYNAERPYQKYDITPVINKRSKGKSMPSRHCFSAAVIAVSLAEINLPLGIVIGVLALLIATLRVAFGVHFIKDVLVGLLLGGLTGAVQYFI